MNEWLVALMLLVVGGLCYWRGRVDGWESCDFGHDFDRCPECEAEKFPPCDNCGARHGGTL